MFYTQTESHSCLLLLVEEMICRYLAHGISNGVHHATHYAHLTGSLIQGRHQVIHCFPHEMGRLGYGFVAKGYLVSETLAVRRERV